MTGFLCLESIIRYLTVSSSFPIFRRLILTIHIGTPCDKYGNDLPKGMPPPPSDGDSVLPPQGDWTPYNDRKEFETADLLFTYQQMSAGNMNKLFNIWEASLVPFDAPPPFTNADDMYEIIDSTPYGDLRWQSFTIRYNLHNDPPSTKAPAAWKTAEYDGWFRDPCKLIRNMLANRGFDKEFDYVPYQEYDYKGQHRFHDVFSGNWCWHQVVSSWYLSFLYRVSPPSSRILLQRIQIRMVP
jgi:hypothetical protein